MGMSSTNTVKVTAGDGGKRQRAKPNQPLQVYIVRRAWEKSHDESHDKLKIDDDIIEVSNQIRKFDAYVSRSCDLLES